MKDDTKESLLLLSIVACSMLFIVMVLVMRGIAEPVYYWWPFSWFSGGLSMMAWDRRGEIKYRLGR